MADPLHQFVIQPLVPLEIAGYDLSFTNSSLWMAIAGISSVVMLMAASRKQEMIPGRFQAFAEMFYEFVANMVRENIGSKGREYFPFVFTVFVTVLFGNVLGLIPGSFTYTSHIIVTAALALLVFFVVTIFGFLKNGFDFLSLFAPPGVPGPLLLLIFPLEVLSFLVRPITLSFRLFANMMAGHLVLKVFVGFCTMLMGLGLAGLILTPLPIFMTVALYALELLVALIHAYIFTVLTCIYLKDTVDLHH